MSCNTCRLCELMLTTQPTGNGTNSVSGSSSTGSPCATIFTKCPNWRWIGNSVLQHHERKLKNVNGALETEHWVNIRRNGNACFSNLPELKVVQCHASLLDARKEFSGKNKNPRVQGPPKSISKQGSFGMSLGLCVEYILKKRGKESGLDMG